MSFVQKRGVTRFKWFEFGFVDSPPIFTDPTNVVDISAASDRIPFPASPTPLKDSPQWSSLCFRSEPYCEMLPTFTLPSLNIAA